jgi:apolipoprotein N-acyltransferase
MNLVPFGEFVPFRHTFPWMQNFTPYENDYSCTPGEAFTRFEFTAAAPGKRDEANEDQLYRFGVLICYEDSDPTMARQYNPWARTGEPVDFLVNISNDGWFNGSEEHEQHLAIARFRAVECRRTLLRAVNMGISAVIDPDGRIKEMPNFAEEGWAASKQVAGTVTADIPLDTRGSMYAALGDWLPLLCWLLMATLLLNGWVRRRTTRRPTPPPPQHPTTQQTTPRTA